jgi:ParB-like chromosome segregation protein Spo0J
MTVAKRMRKTRKCIGVVETRNLFAQERRMDAKLKANVAKALKALAFIGQVEDMRQRIEAINLIRETIHAASPFAGEPVDCVRWVPCDEVEANDYNPNAVAPVEMELLAHSIAADGYTQPIVTWKNSGINEVVDGFHRNRVGKENDDVRARVHGYLPVVTINEGREDLGDRMAATIRHNRARGKHKIDAMSEIVVALKRRNWSDERIAKELGMEPDEVLRLAQITGLAALFKDADFSEAWEADLENEGDSGEQIDAE